jgi:hypothetical protein
VSGSVVRSDLETYLDRKRREVDLIASYSKYKIATQPRRLSDYIDLKFRLAALLKSERAQIRWDETETKWAAGLCRSGSYAFGYGYQRADLSVEGPAVYPWSQNLCKTTFYTISGMAALCCSFAAVKSFADDAWFDLPPDGYSESKEFITHVLGQPASRPQQSLEVPLLDSAVASGFAAPAADFPCVIVDTTCVARSSGRLRAIVQAVLKRGGIAILARSHTKLDMLGTEFGRLGSIVVICAQRNGMYDNINAAAARVIRLTGCAPVPAHFAPFASGREYHELTRQRLAQITCNTRHLAGQLRKTLPAADLRTYQHGLYITLLSHRPGSQQHATALAHQLTAGLWDVGIPARTAGSFGFDFLVSEWFVDPLTQKIGVRLSMADLPRSMITAAVPVIEQWCRSYPALNERRCA